MIENKTKIMAGKDAQIFWILLKLLKSRRNGMKLLPSEKHVRSRGVLGKKLWDRTTGSF